MNHTEEPNSHSVREIEQLARQAVSCRECFVRGHVQDAAINIAQPRWIGPNYWAAKPRVVILMLNPGGGGTTANPNHEPCRLLIEDFRSGRVSLQDLFREQGEEMESWGRPRGKFRRFYLDHLGLRKDDIAFANIAWCSTARDKYPQPMLSECFQRHTRRLLELLEPDLIVASGSAVRQFLASSGASFGPCEVVHIPHYANRGSNLRSDDALRLARTRIAALRFGAP